MNPELRRQLLRLLIQDEIKERGLNPELIRRAIRDINGMQDRNNWFLIYDVPTEDGGTKVVVCFDSPSDSGSPWDYANNIWANLCQLAEIAGFEVQDER